MAGSRTPHTLVRKLDGRKRGLGQGKSCRLDPSMALSSPCPAGYMGNEAPIPSPPVTHDMVRDFQAVGDGIFDNTEIFQRAVDSLAPGSVLYIPPGEAPSLPPLSLPRDL
jgi:hypothetical protein